MKTFKIEVTGKTESAIEDALREVIHSIAQRGNLSGFDRNEWGSYTFDSSGEYDEDEDEDE